MNQNCISNAFSLPDDQSTYFSSVWNVTFSIQFPRLVENEIENSVFSHTSQSYLFLLCILQFLMFSFLISSLSIYMYVSCDSLWRKYIRYCSRSNVAITLGNKPFCFSICLKSSWKQKEDKSPYWPKIILAIQPMNFNRRWAKVKSYNFY